MSNISSEAILEKNNILSNMQSIVLSTIDSGGAPNASYAPSVIDSDGNFYIYISELSQHTRNLLVSPSVSAMIIEDESMSDNLFARKRLTIRADSNEIERDTDEWGEKMDLMEHKFGESISYLKNLTDFRMFKLKPKSGLLVYGFARAFHFTGRKLDEIKYLNEKGHTQKKKD